MFANSGVKVHGVDTNPEVINKIQKKQLHIHEPGLEEAMLSAINSGAFTVSSQPEEADAFIIAVQTPIAPNKSAEISYVVKAAESIIPYLKKGNLVILESTVPPKTVETVLVTVLKRSNLTVGSELLVCHSPERIIPGKMLEELVYNDRIVGGINLLSSQVCAELYQRFVKGTIHITDATTAEMVKLMENTYRDVNIALVNELALIAERIGYNIWEAIELANSHPRVFLHKPGPGVGGHCIAVDPWFIVEKAAAEAKLITLARNTNDEVPFRVVRRIEQMVHNIDEPVITLLGLAFKGDIDDMRDSPSIVIANELERKGYKLKLYDPHIKQDIVEKAQTLQEAVRGSDCLVLLTDHSVFKKLDFDAIKEQMRTLQILDTRNMFDVRHLRQLGFSSVTMGLAYER